MSDPCEIGLPAGHIYWGKMVLILNAEPPSAVQFSIQGYPGQTFSVNWNDSTAVWPNCSTVQRQNNSSGRLFLSDVWLDANRVEPAPGDPKIPKAGPTEVGEYHRLRVVVEEVTVRYRAVRAPPQVGETPTFDTTRCLPRSVEPNQVPYVEGAEGDLWVTMKDLEDNGLLGRDEPESRTWPDPVEAVQALISEGVLTIVDGAFLYHPKGAADVLRLASLLFTFQGQNRSLDSIIPALGTPKAPAKKRPK